MSHLRFSVEEYQALRRLAQDIPLGRTALRHFLVAYLPLHQLQLAHKIARLDNRQMRLLHTHFRKLRRQAAMIRAQRQPLTEEECQLFAQACDSLCLTMRFVRYYRKSLVEQVRAVYPALARKLSRLSARRFEQLYQQIHRRRGDNA